MTAFNGFFTYFWRFLKVLNGFRYISKNFYGVRWFLTYSQLFFMIFYVFLMIFYVFHTIFDDCGRIFDGQCCFLRNFFVGFDGFNQFLTYLGCFGLNFWRFSDSFFGFRRFSIVFDSFHWSLYSFWWFFIYLWHFWTVFDDFWSIM